MPTFSSFSRVLNMTKHFGTIIKHYQNDLHGIHTLMDNLAYVYF
jgi:hypothetical protein